MADQSLVHVESEIVQSHVDASMTPQIQLVAEWIALEVLAQNDPRRMNMTMPADIAMVLDRLDFGYIFTEHAALRDKLIAHIQSLLTDFVHVGDELNASINTSFVDQPRLSEVLRSTVASVLEDYARANDAVRFMLEGFASEHISVTERLSAKMQVFGVDMTAGRDVGVLMQHNYVDTSYVNLGYFGEAYTF